jgi:hypothetical protein
MNEHFCRSCGKPVNNGNTCILCYRKMLRGFERYVIAEVAKNKVGQLSSEPDGLPVEDGIPEQGSTVSSPESLSGTNVL